MTGKLTVRHLAMLSLLAWHFDSSMVPLPRGLLQIFMKLNKQFDTVCKSIHLSYIIMGGPDSLVNFNERFSKQLGLLE
jgi:hypothetical protein